MESKIQVYLDPNALTPVRDDILAFRQRYSLVCIRLCSITRRRFLIVEALLYHSHNRLCPPKSQEFYPFVEESYTKR